jgi:hypothetical protein
MDFLIGTMLILGMIAVAYLAPVIVVRMTGNPKHFRRLVRISNDQRAENVAGRKGKGRPGTRLNPF